MGQCLLHLLLVSDIDVITQKIERDSAIHGAAVDKNITELFGQCLGKGTFSTTGPTVEGNYNRLCSHGSKIEKEHRNDAPF